MLKFIKSLEAVLFEVDLKEYADEELTAIVAKTAEALATCARASQPCVIYFKQIQRIFYGKVRYELKFKININTKLIQLQNFLSNYK